MNAKSMMSVGLQFLQMKFKAYNKHFAHLLQKNNAALELHCNQKTACIYY
jgi:hypothetical protein